MRLASFTAGQAEVIVTQFGKDGFGGTLANINRWRGEAGLPGIADEKDSPALAITVNGKEGALFDFASAAGDPSPKRVRVAMIYDGQEVWFFKLRGPADTVAQQQPNFDAFLKSVQFTGQTQ